MGSLSLITRVRESHTILEEVFVTHVFLSVDVDHKRDHRDPWTVNLSTLRRQTESSFRRLGSSI